MSVGKNRIVLWAAFAVSMTVCFLLDLWGSVSVIEDAISVVAFIAVIVCCYRVAPHILVKYLFFWVSSAWAIVAVFLLENGSVNLRGRGSEHFGSEPIYILSWLVFFAVLCFLELRNTNTVIAKPKSFAIVQDDTNTANVLRMDSAPDTIAYLAIALLVGAMLTIIYQPYFLLGVDRFEYAQTHSGPLLKSLRVLFYCLLPVVLMTRNRRASTIYIMLFAMFLIWQGEKFSGLFTLVCYVLVCISSIAIAGSSRERLQRILKFAVVVVGSLLIVVSAHQMLLFQSATGNLASYFYDRIAAQGELWWLTYGADKDNGYHLDEIEDELDVWINQPDTQVMSDYNFGIYKMMKKFMNSSWVQSTLEEGVRATEASRASLFYYGKMPGLIIGQLIFGLLAYLAINGLATSCVRGDWLRAALYVLVAQAVIAAIAMMDIQLLTTKRMLFVYGVLVLSLILVPRKKRINLVPSKEVGT